MKDCEDLGVLVWGKALLCLASFLYAVYWSARFYLHRSYPSHPLHRVACIFLWSKTCSDLNSLLLLSSCPFISPLTSLFTTAGQVTFTLSTTLSFFLVLLVTLGFGVSKPSLNQRETMQIVVLLVLAFCGFFLYMLAPKSLMLVAVTIVGVLFAISVKFTIESMRRLEAMEEVFRAHYWIGYLQRIEEKWEMYGKVYYLVVVFYAAQLVSLAGLHAIFELADTPSLHLHLYLWIDAFESLLEAFSLFSICHLVRTQDASHSLTIEWEESDNWDVPLYMPLFKGQIEAVCDFGLPVLVLSPAASPLDRTDKDFSLGVPLV